MIMPSPLNVLYIVIIFRRIGPPVLFPWTTKEKREPIALSAVPMWTANKLEREEHM